MIEWEPFAQRLGYSSAADMWRDLYTTKELSITQIAKKLNVSRNVVRANIQKTAGVTMKGRGGRNNSHVVVSDDLLEDIKREGLRAVAIRKGLNYSTLYKRLRVRGISIESLKAETAESPESVSQQGSNPLPAPLSEHLGHSESSPTGHEEPPAGTSSGSDLPGSGRRDP